MYVITSDQVGSRTSADIVGPRVERINEEHGAHLLLPADRNAGDELQALTGDPGTALTLVLELTRSSRWSVGLGVGPIRLPLPGATREASGPAFFAARNAVTRAKKQATRFAAQLMTESDETQPARDVEALIDLVILLRQRRTANGWEVYDLLETGMTQQDAAIRLGITPPAVSARASAAGIRAEQNAKPALIRMLSELDRTTNGTDAPS